MANSSKICKTCGIEFIDNRSGNHKTCSKECSAKNTSIYRSYEYKKKYNYTEKRAEHYKLNSKRIKARVTKHYYDVAKERRQQLILCKCDICDNDYYKQIYAYNKKSTIFNCCSEDCKGKLKSIIHSGSDSCAWKGGITPTHNFVRNSDENKKWICGVLKKDGYKCQKCGEVHKITAHHIVNFKDLYLTLDDKLWDVNNGITFCRTCHKEFHRIYGINNNEQQIKDFLCQTV